ncbi:MAG: FecR domain-containing protein [Deltaproteobacteria bacterium]|nr:FecR domain-containing protein [Deltaproteobacteria bacterium]
MTSSGETGKECERFRELADRRAAGDEPDADDAVALAEHFRSCPECATDGALAGFAAELDEPGPARVLDAAATERWVEGVVAAAGSGSADCAGSARGDATAGTAGEPRSGRAAGASAVSPIVAYDCSPWGWGRWLALGAMAVSALAMGLILAFGGSRDRRAPSAVSPAGAELFAVAGRATVAGGAAFGGRAIAVGERVAVDHGRAGLRLCGAVELFLDAATTVRLVEQRTGRCEVYLESGRVVADARGLAGGARLIVSSAVASVQVVGTIFAVEVFAAEVQVRVLEGVVEVVIPPQPSRRLVAGQSMSLPGGGPTPLDAAEAERDRRLAGWFPAGEAPAAPPGATVRAGPAAAVATTSVRVTTDGCEPAAPAARKAAARVGGAGEGAASATVSGDSSPARIGEPGGPPAGEPDARVTRPQDAPGARSPVPVESSGDAIVPPPSSPAAPAVPATPTAAGLLDVARRLRTDGDWAGTAAAYEGLLARFPDSAEARVALVPLGQLRLERLGDAVGALAAFDSYLAHPSATALREEASWGRIQALQALGRLADETEALQGFLAAYPASLRVDAARRRLAELGVTP